MNDEQKKRYRSVINMKQTDFERLRDELKRLSPLQLQHLQGDIQLALLKKDNDILSLEERDALAKLFV
ncbi:hypothetical protein D8T51_16905 [Vibrio vulnificus]|jgi:hypothetical protein|uniref:Uncharacterized protein n=2 Tax=Vibrionaceae TaxID=641 RepID=A0A087IR25_VIBVL|nr:hypothetical protein AOT11_06170 [Vibrio vulnificus NBRC 15645 = ATCC 27562]AVX02279.1 hypothetical protein BJD94_20790 [Vibrio vulnificus Env1]EGQ7692356.1 hypothetical protein [Vibrio vulnificus]OZT85963.1 hypothetical protein CIK04_03820 [Vibrio sp. 03_296]EGQ7758046.1 hypothetical protein [Vibrio vulnificus]